jgi:hypothetical protein
LDGLGNIPLCPLILPLLTQNSACERCRSAIGPPRHTRRPGVQ